MTVYCVMEIDAYGKGDTPDALVNIWANKKLAEKEVARLNEDAAPYSYYVREEDVETDWIE